MWIILSNYVRYLNQIRYAVPEAGNHYGGTCQNHIYAYYTILFNAVCHCSIKAIKMMTIQHDNGRHIDF